LKALFENAKGNGVMVINIIVVMESSLRSI
jgi:hypothetical protein